MVTVIAYAPYGQAAKLDAVMGEWEYEPLAGSFNARNYLLSHPRMSKHVVAFMQVRGQAAPIRIHAYLSLQL